MSTKLTTIIFLITLIIVESHYCDWNEIAVYNYLTQSRFPICNNPKTRKARICRASCVCKKNYVKNDDGKCQPKECPANSSFKMCREIIQHQCINPVTDINGAFEADCVCDPGHYWFNEFKGCMTLENLLDAYSYESRPRFG